MNQCLRQNIFETFCPSFLLPSPSFQRSKKADPASAAFSTAARFAVASRAVISNAVTEVGAFPTMVMELARVEVDIPIAEASDEVPTATIAVELLFIVALDCGMFSSIFIFVPSIFNLVQSIPDGTGKLFGAAIAATLEQNLIQIDRSLLGEWYMS